MQAHEIVPGLYRSGSNRLLTVTKVTREDDRLVITYQWANGKKPKTSVTRHGIEWNMEPENLIIEEDAL